MQVAGLQPDEAYDLRLRAQNAKGWGYFSSVGPAIRTKASDLNPTFTPANSTLELDFCRSIYCKLSVRSSGDPQLPVGAQHFQLEYRATHESTWKTHNKHIEFTASIEGVRVEEVILKRDENNSLPCSGEFSLSIGVVDGMERLGKKDMFVSPP